MKKLILTTGVIAALAGSQLGFAACVTSGNPNATSATCDSTVTLGVAKLVVLKGLDDYDFSNPSANGWDGTAGTNATIKEAICVGTNDLTNGVDITFDSANAFKVSTGGTETPVAYSAYFNGGPAALNNGGGAILTIGLENLACAVENFALNVEFTGTALLTAAVGGAYSDTITVTVAPN